ncbi:MAG TPA: TRAP transporter small permease [Spirochaetia bacterium]|nr:TRAP transporter small permease [Spirochaetales bacterium]HRY79199.1 TRAP transporter small permease [Spirochaetia bacterium]HRZ88613.1 TRAP transporter small permease [Spirochaetia bacterium]
MKAYKNLLDAVNRGTLWIAILAAAVMSVLVILQVVFRYAIQSSLSFSEELARFLFVWTAFLGSAVALAKRAHVSIEIVVAHLPRKLKRGAILVTNGLGAIFFLILIVYGILMTIRTLDQTSAAMELSMGFVYVVVPLSGLIMLMNLVYNGYEEFMNPDIIKSEGVE